MTGSTIKGIHSAASLAKLTAGRKAKIQKLADMEAERSKKSRLESLLSQKLVAKYGTRLKSQTNRVIKKTVKDFLAGASHISEKDLKSVEEKVKQVSSVGSDLRGFCCLLISLLHLTPHHAILLPFIFRLLRKLPLRGPLSWRLPSTIPLLPGNPRSLSLPLQPLAKRLCYWIQTIRRRTLGQSWIR